MCGIVGAFGKITPLRKKVVEEMFLIDIYRGIDSCGMALVHNNGVDVVKDKAFPDDLMREEGYIQSSNKDGLVAMIGHNRWATRGSTELKNAHPFKHSPITLVHNGTVWTHKFIKTYTEADTDSERIALAIRDETIEKVWPKVDGPATLVWWNEEMKKLNMITNGKRPMFFMELYDGENNADMDGILFASEAWMIRSACKRHEHPFNIKDLYFPKPHVLYEFDDNNGVGYTSTKLEEFKEYVYNPGAYQSNYNAIQWPNRRPRDFYGAYGYDPYGDSYDYDRAGEGIEHADSCKCSECASKDIQRVVEKANEGQPEQKVLPFRSNEPAWKTLKINVRTKRISEDVFRRDYTSCICCGGALHDDFDRCMVINYVDKQAACSMCVDTAELTNMDVRNMRMQ